MYIEKYNESFLLVTGNKHEEQELSDKFTFKVPGYKFMPAYKAGVWSGDIKLYNIKTKLIYTGLFQSIVDFASTQQYDVEYDPRLFSQTDFSVSQATKFIDSLNLPSSIDVRDYQLQTFIDAVRFSRKTFVSPTASGKSLMIYLIARYFNLKTIIIVPTTGLIHQMADDFASYGYSEPIDKISSGKSKNPNNQITVSTWQSIYKMPRQWYEQFDLVICDEVHLAKAQSLTNILTKMDKCKYRFGFTGTLDGTQTNQMVIQGLFGPIKTVTTTTELIDNKHLSAFSVKCIVLQYPDQVKKDSKAFNYTEEIEYIVTNEARNNFIKNLAVSLEGNTLVLFQFVDKHGKILRDKIEKNTKRPVFFVHGGVDGEERNNLRGFVEENQNSIIVASVATFSTGINIPSLKNIIFASPSKSRIRTLQSIGRVLRKSANKTQSVLFDVSDNLSWKSHKNYTILHFFERLKIYNEQNFPYKVYNVNLETS